MRHQHKLVLKTIQFRVQILHPMRITKHHRWIIKSFLVVQFIQIDMFFLLSKNSRIELKILPVPKIHIRNLLEFFPRHDYHFHHFEILEIRI